MSVATFMLIALAVALGHVLGLAMAARWATLAGRRVVRGILAELRPLLALLGRGRHG